MHDPEPSSEPLTAQEAQKDVRFASWQRDDVPVQQTDAAVAERRVWGTPSDTLPNTDPAGRLESLRETPIVIPNYPAIAPRYEPPGVRRSGARPALSTERAALRLRVLGAVVAVLCVAPLSAQEVFSAGAQQPPGDVFNGVAIPAEDLHKYLGPDGRFIDRCRYWHDHPDADTQRYGWPDRFAPGQPMGETRSFNGVPAPYGRCAIDPCPPNGTICWRNPAAGKGQPPRTAQIEDWLRQRGCKPDGTGAIYCAGGLIPAHPGPPGQPLSGSLVRTRCHVTGTGIACDTTGSGTPTNDDFGSGSRPAPPDKLAPWTFIPKPPGPPPKPTYARVTPDPWSSAPPCPKASAPIQRGPMINYFEFWDPHSWNIDWVSDSNYITVAGHGGPGVSGVGSNNFTRRNQLISVDTIARDIHKIRSLPGNSSKGIRIAACESADTDPKDPGSVPLAQQVADAYRRLYGESVTVEGFQGCIQFHRPDAFASFPCKLFTSREPINEPLSQSIRPR
jgi:hypothetical protein